MDLFDTLSNLTDSKIRHLVGFLPAISFVLIFGYDSIIKILSIGILITLSALFEFNWTIFNENKKKTKEIMYKYNSLRNEKRLTEKEQWNFF